MQQAKVLNVNKLSETIASYDALCCTATQVGEGRYQGVAYVFGTTGHLVPVQLEVLVEKERVAFGLEGVVVATQEQVTNGLATQKEITVAYQTQQPPHKSFTPLHLGEITLNTQERDVQEPAPHNGAKYVGYELWQEYKIPEFDQLVKASEVYDLFIDQKRSKEWQRNVIRARINSSKYLAEMKDSQGNPLPAEMTVGKKPYFTNATAKELTKELIQAGFAYHGNSFCA